MAKEVNKVIVAIDKKADDRVKKSSTPKVLYGTDSIGNQMVYKKFYKQPMVNNSLEDTKAAAKLYSQNNPDVLFVYIAAE